MQAIVEIDMPKKSKEPATPFDPIGDFLRWRSNPSHHQTRSSAEQRLVQALAQIAHRHPDDQIGFFQHHFPWVSTDAVLAFIAEVAGRDDPDFLRLFDEYFPPTPRRKPLMDRVKDLGGRDLAKLFRGLETVDVTEDRREELLDHLRCLTRDTRMRVLPETEEREARNRLKQIQKWLREGQTILWPGLNVRRVTLNTQVDGPIPQGFGPHALEGTGELIPFPAPLAPTVRKLRKAFVHMQMMIISLSLVRTRSNRGSVAKGLDTNLEVKRILDLLMPHAGDSGSPKRGPRKKALEELAKEMLKTLKIRRLRKTKKEIEHPGT